MALIFDSDIGHRYYGSETGDWGQGIKPWTDQKDCLNDRARDAKAVILFVKQRIANVYSSDFFSICICPSNHDFVVKSDHLE